MYSSGLKLSVVVGITVFALAGCSATQSPIATPAASKLDVPVNSVVKILSTAEKCGVRDHGSGSVVGKDLILTNAHVVAGTSELEISNADLPANKTGKVVYFDPQLDIALVQVKGLGLPALAIGAELTTKDSITAYGFNPDGSLRTEKASLVKKFSWKAKDIFGAGGFNETLYRLDADIEHGNSGGPVIDDSNVIRAMILGKDGSEAKRAFAITAADLADALSKLDLSKKVSNSKCIK